MSETSDLERLMNQRLEYVRKLEIVKSEKYVILGQLESKNDELAKLYCSIKGLDEILLSYGVTMAGGRIERCNEVADVRRNEVADESFKGDLEFDEKKLIQTLMKIFAKVN